MAVQRSRGPPRGGLLRVRTVATTPVCSSGEYWERRYREGGNSGPGSYNRLARFKANVLNRFVLEHRIASVIELGCGDGAQLALANYPSYVGVDVSPTAVLMCQRRFEEDQTKQFVVAWSENLGTFDLALSLDVLFHLVEDVVFDDYMRILFKAASKYVVIYSSNRDNIDGARHVKHRRFSEWIKCNAPECCLISKIRNKYPYSRLNSKLTSFSDFYIYALRSCSSAQGRMSIGARW
jgi:SAM-dependent methyltransferase